MRFGPKGLLDKSFGNRGKVITAFGPAYEYAYGVAVQPNGKIVVVGRALRGPAPTSAWSATRRGGSLDGTFGARRQGRSPTSSAATDTARGVALQTNGKIVVAGDAATGTTRRRMAVARYLKASPDRP